ncbi:MAG TPA: hypothetical protein VFM94_09695, partial [Solirubrobacterales bacterium]|nr:hypothetical protein [Solirubrobacterales bacterium]
EIGSSPSSKVQGNWFGVALDGAVVGNETGVVVGPGSNSALIGGEVLGQGNAFAGQVKDGLDVHGGSNIRVFGNYFGVEPDGTTPAPNGGDDIEVATTEGVEMIGTKIGTRVSTAAAASPLCDGGCNVISGAASNGIDLQGDGESEVPAASTSIAGNYVGLDAAGAVAIPNTDAGVRAGQAADTAIGGPSVGEANRINGGSVGVLAGPAASDLAVRGNLIGTDADGLEALGPPKDGVVVDSAELPSPAAEAEIVGNVIGMAGGVAIEQRGEGAWISGNEIFSAQTGVRTVESTVEHGNVIEGNSIEGAVGNGVLVENDFNEIVGNAIVGSGAAGVRVQGASLPFGVTGNLVGGDTEVDENVIDGNGGAAVEISNLEATSNEVARNRGIGNAAPFIDLIAASPSTEVGPNRGIEPPSFATATPDEAAGGAEEGATVRVFRKQITAAGEIESFLGEAVADSSGGWELTYDAAVPAGTIVAATQTLEGATSELAVATVPGSEGTTGEGGGSAGAASGGGASGSPENEMTRVRPQTKIVKGRVRNHTARFLFKADQARSDFLCKLDDKPFDLCRPPKRYSGLAPGRHVFWVRAVDPAGRVDLSPAKKKFVIPG